MLRILQPSSGYSNSGCSASSLPSNRVGWRHGEMVGGGGYLNRPLLPYRTPALEQIQQLQKHARCDTADHHPTV